MRSTGPGTGPELEFWDGGFGLMARISLAKLGPNPAEDNQNPLKCGGILFALESLGFDLL